MLQKGINQFAKMSCRWRYGRLLSAYVDDELDANAVQIIASHLSECARCRIEFEALRFAKKALVEFEIPAMRSPLVGGHVFRLPALKEVSPLKRLYSQKIAVPLPLAASVVIALISAILFATARNQRTPIQTTVSIPAQPSAVIKVVEVPVDRPIDRPIDRIVNRTVYLRQSGSGRVRGTRKENRFTSVPPDSKGNIAQNDTTTEWSASTLKDFRPAASANLRVVKEQEK
jgi:putative zinc finger protein